MRGKLIVIEGVDGCGKQTQSELLVNKLNALGIKATRISFPSYESLSSGPVRLYLNGDLGALDEIKSKPATLLYLVDQYCTLKLQHVEERLEAGEWFICDRYAESNMIFQLGKLLSQEAINDAILGKDSKVFEDLFMSYRTWFDVTVYHDMGFVVPDRIFLLDVGNEVTREIRSERETPKFADATVKKDLHECNDAFIDKCSDVARLVARKCSWYRIECGMTVMYERDYINSAIFHSLYDFLVEEKSFC